MMHSFMLMSFVVISLFAFRSVGECAFKAIIVFGDSNSDTGGLVAAFPSQNPPYGITYFKKPVGRFSDGRLLVDFLAQALGLPFVSPYLQSIGSNFETGVNFASAGSTASVSKLYSPFYLDIQLNQMKEFKKRVEEHHSSPSGIGTKLPDAKIFSKSLYIFYIGQNDFTQKLNLNEVVSNITEAIKEVYGFGGRTFLVLNLAPLGCYPFTLAGTNNKSDVDTSGCVASSNIAVKHYNFLLKTKIDEVRKDLPDGNLIYTDTFSVLTQIFDNPTFYGFEDATTACCGYGGGYNFNMSILCGTPSSTACADPDRFVSWDGIHLTESANKILASAVLNESYFDPPFSLSKLCKIKNIG